MLIYLSTFLSTVLLSYIKKYGKVLSFILIVLFIGLRHGVGTDFFSYESIYERSMHYEAAEVGIEYGYWWLNRFIGHTVGAFWGVTLVHALIVMGLFYAVFRKFSFFPFALLLFLLDTSCGYAMTVNTMRQMAAVALFFFSVRYIERKELLKYSLLIVLASLFHISVLFVWPVYFVAGMKIGQRWLLAAYVLVVFLSYAGVWEGINQRILAMTPYKEYLFSQYNKPAGGNSGMAILVWRLLGILLLMNYGRMLKKYPNFRIYLSLFVIFIIAREVLIGNVVMYRMRFYFEWSECVVYPLFFTLFDKRSKILMQALFILWMSILFIKFYYEPLASLAYQTIL